MGTDIHMYVERRASADSPWTSADVWSDNEYAPGKKIVRYEDQLFHDRSYDTFAILADVRNGRGFAGVKTGEGFVPISAPRGLPTDISPELQALMNEGIEHTPTWLTLADIQSYDWTQTTTKSGIVDLDGLVRWKQSGRPESWSGMISGPGIEIFEAEPVAAAIDEYLDKLQVERHGGRKSSAEWRDIRSSHEMVRPGVEALLRLRTGVQRPHFRVTWQVSYADAASEFLWKVVPRLWRLGSPDNVRLVFYFDS